MTGYQQRVDEALALFGSLRGLEEKIQSAATCCVTALLRGGKLLICGNGGSAAEAQHLAGELVGRFQCDRAPLPAISLAADTAVLSCIGNDYRFEDVFARQVQALGRPGDVLVAFSTSGASANVVAALTAARAARLTTIAFLGESQACAARPLADCAIPVPHRDTARIQEAHQFLMHCLMVEIEAGLKNVPIS